QALQAAPLQTASRQDRPWRGVACDSQRRFGRLQALQAAPLQTAPRRDSDLERSRLRLPEAFRTPPGESKRRRANFFAGGRFFSGTNSSTFGLESTYNP